MSFDRHPVGLLRAIPLAVSVVALAACASTSTATGGTQMASVAPSQDPRVGLRAGLMDAAEALWNLQVVSKTPPSERFVGATNSDLSFSGHYAIQGSYSGFQVWDIANPARPTLTAGYLCPASQSDVSVYRNLLFVSGEGMGGRLDCGTQGVHDSVSADRLRGIRIFDISDFANPRYIGNVQTCRGSHTHTVVVDPSDTDNVYIYVSGRAAVRSPNELPGCSAAYPDSDANSALFRIEVIQVPLAAPQQARIVSTPRIFEGLTAPARHGEAPQDVAAAAREVAAARAQGAFIVTANGQDMVLSSRFISPLLDSIVKARQGTGSPTAADSMTLRAALPSLYAQFQAAERQRVGNRTGPTQCHDITVYPAIGLAGGACGGYGMLLDIHDVAHPRRLAAVADSNFSFWHSATFNNEGTKLLFSDEWGGGGQPKCRATDRPEWGADAIFTLTGDSLRFQSYYKMMAPQTEYENCVAHNGSLIPIPGRDIMVQAWYQGGISVFDWTDPAHPKEIAFFDRGPVDSTKMGDGGAWSAYWYNGNIYSSEIARGLDVLALTPSAFISQNEIDAAKLVHLDYFNTQGQPKLVWPASFAVARAYLDQLGRSNGLPAARITAVRAALAAAEGQGGQARRDALTQLATQLTTDAATAGEQWKVKQLAGAITDLANAQ